MRSTESGEVTLPAQAGQWATEKAGYSRRKPPHKSEDLQKHIAMRQGIRRTAYDSDALNPVRFSLAGFDFRDF